MSALLFFYLLKLHQKFKSFLVQSFYLKLKEKKLLNLTVLRNRNQKSFKSQNLFIIELSFKAYFYFDFDCFQ